MKWELLFRVPGGHKYFSDGQGNIAVADDSGDTPDKTDDGPLYVSTSSPVRVGKHACISVVTPDGLPNSVMECAEDGLYVAVKLGMTINVRGKNYRLVEDIDGRDTVRR